MTIEQARILDALSQQTVQRYGERFSRLGRHVRTLGWGCEQHQQIRFSQTLRLLPQPCGSLLDIGCGFADLLAFLQRRELAPENYIGWDITPSFIAECRTLHAGNSRASFELCNLSERPSSEPVADCGVMLGLLNFNWKGQINNLEYTQHMLRKAFAAVRDTLVVDFLSTRLTPDYPAEPAVFYHEPAEMLEVALLLTPSITLIHDYPAIPQREFMLALRHL